MKQKKIKDEGIRYAALLKKANQILRAVDLLSLAMVYVGGVNFILISLFITFDVVGRSFFHLSSRLTDEIGSYSLVLGGMWALAYALRTGAHVRIDILLPHFPRRMQIFLDYLALALMALFGCVTAFSVWQLTLDSFTVDARASSLLQTPLFLPQGLLALGLTVLSIEAIAILGVKVIESISVGGLEPIEEIRQGSEPNKEV